MSAVHGIKKKPHQKKDQRENGLQVGPKSQEPRGQGQLAVKMKMKMNLTYQSIKQQPSLLPVFSQNEKLTRR
jgi:hypothetical protein